MDPPPCIDAVPGWPLVLSSCTFLFSSPCLLPCLLCRREHAAYRELSQRLERHEKLSRLAGQLEQDKQLMGKGRKRKLTAVTEDGSSTAAFKWKRERKK